MGKREAVESEPERCHHLANVGFENRWSVPAKEPGKPLVAQKGKTKHNLGSLLQPLERNTALPTPGF